MNTEKLHCPVQKKCGGCQMLNLTYNQQLSKKMADVISLMGKFCHVDEIHGMEDPTHYRNKVQSAFGFVNGKQITESEAKNIEARNREYMNSGDWNLIAKCEFIVIV